MKRPQMAWLRTNGLRRAGAVVVIAMLPMACAADEADKFLGGIPHPGVGSVGNYLAGRHAQALQDTSAAAVFYRAVLAKDPNNPALLRRALVAMLVDGRQGEAVSLAKRVLEQTPKRPIATLMLISDSMIRGDFSVAEKMTIAMPDKGVFSFLRPLFQAWILAGSEQWDDALAAIKPLASRDGYQVLHALHAALINDLAGRNIEAEKQYLNALGDEGPKSLRVVNLFGSFYERTGQPDAARSLYQQYQNSHSPSQLVADGLRRIDSDEVPPRIIANGSDGAAETLFDIASSLRNQNARETAQVFSRIATFLKPDFPMNQLLLSRLFEDLNAFENANRVLHSINAASPLSWAAQLKIASNLSRMERIDEAIAHLQKLAAGATDQAEPLIELGDILRNQERFDEAVDAYDKAFALIDTIESRHWGLLYSRGIALERSRRWERAEVDFLKALEVKPDQPYVMNYLGYSWVEKGMHLDRAQEMIRKAVELRPTDGFIVDSLGWVYFKLGRFADAARELERAVELRAEDPVINDHLGDAFWRVGRRSEARFQWRRALSLNPASDQIPLIENKIENGLKGVSEPLSSSAND